ncbi:MAG: DUF748 domain-containing protein [Desulfovibrionales bacterium]|nr:DUF748 domain-containing protein [Desulfovibrionales bacterium]
MRLPQRFKSAAFYKKAFLGVLIGLFIFTVVGFFVLPPILKSLLIEKLSEELHREVIIREIKVNPFALSLGVKGFAVKELGGSETFISFEELFANLQSVSIFKKGLIFKEIRLQKPYLNVKRNADKTYNFSDLLGPDREKETTKSKPLRFSLNNIQILNGSVDFWDGPKQTRHKVRDLSIAIPFISNLPYLAEEYVKPSFEAEINNHPVSLKGKSKPFADSHETTLDVNIKHLDIPYYLAYIPSEMNFKVLSGYLDMMTTIYYVQYSEKEPSINIKGNLELKELKVRDHEDEFLNVPVINVRDLGIDPVKKQVVVGNFSTQDGIVTVRHAKDGTLNLQTLLPPSDEKAEKPWLALLNKLLVEKYTVRFQDMKPYRTVKLSAEKLRLEMEHVSTAKDSMASTALSFTLGRKGSVSATGSIGIDPAFADIKLDVRGIDITPLQPYFTDKIKIIVTDGNINAKGNLSAGYSKASRMKLIYRGDAAVSSFSSIDKADGDDFLKCKSLYLNKVDVAYDPLYVKINGIALTDFYSRLVINADGSLNVQNIMEAQGEKAQGQDKPGLDKEEKTGKLIKIEKLTLQGGTVNFTDKSIKPTYTANLLKIGGRISGLSSEETKLADVDVRSKLENYAPIEITGKINPLKKDLYVDLKVDFKDIEMGPFTPYSGKHMGYTIEKGKLFLNLQYLIVKRKLDSQNRIFLDRFTLGNRVESPDATKLPVRLAIALLKNRNGEINLDIPVTGSLDDPKFRVGRIIIKIILNILEKAATAPFALLGAIFGGGEELSYVEFDYGSPDISEHEIKKLDTLIKALYERPSLKLEITGHVDTEKDREGLRKYIFDKKIRAQKLKDMIKEGQTAISVDEIKIEGSEYAKYLKKAYKNEKFPKPRNIIGIAKDLPVPEMEKLIFTHIEVKDDDLRLLASQRALKVKDYILKSKQIEQEKIFLVEPKTLQPENKESLKNSRVDFKLK